MKHEAKGTSGSFTGCLTNANGFIGSLEYGAFTDYGEEWHEINVFISTNEAGEPVANFKGKRIPWDELTQLFYPEYKTRCSDFFEIWKCYEHGKMKNDAFNRCEKCSEEHFA